MINSLILFYSLLLTLASISFNSTVNTTQYSIFNDNYSTLDSMSTCDTIKQKIINRDFINWNGLPDNCDWTSLVGEYPLDWELRTAFPFGSSYKRRPIMMASVEGYDYPSFAFENGEAVLFQGQGPQVPDVQALIEHFGEAAACLDWQFGYLPCRESECVYPERGITLFLNSDRDRLFHIALYKPTTLENYMDNLRPKLGSKRRPRRR